MRGRGAGEERLVDVVLDDVLPDDAAREAAVASAVTGAAGDDRADAGRTQARPARRRRGRVAGAAAAVLALGLGVVANVAEAAADRERAARLAALDGVVADLGEPLVVSWTVDGYVMADLGDLLLLDTLTGMRAVDPVSGEAVWSLRDVAASGGPPVEYCRPSSGDGLGWPAEPTPPEVLVCVPQHAIGQPDASTSLALPVVDARTGAVRHTLRTTGALVGVDAVDGAVVALTADGDGALRAVAWEELTGAVRWEVTTAARPYLAGGTGLDALGWERRGDVLSVSGSRGQAAVDLATGREVDPAAVREAEAPPPLRAALPDGGSVAIEWDGGSGQVLDADGSVRFEVDGVPLVVPVDDGTVDDVLLVARDGLRALDARTGRELWRHDLELAVPVVAVDGTLVVTDHQRTVALDLRTGDVRWEVTSERLLGGGGVTDGDLVLLPEADDDGSALVARTVADGTVAWRVPVEGRLWDVSATSSGTVIAVTDQQVLGLAHGVG